MNQPKETDSKSDWMVYAYHLEDLLEAKESAPTGQQRPYGGNG